MEHKIITDLAYTYIGLVTTMTKHYVDEGVPLLFNSSIRAEGIDFSNPIYLDNEFAEDNKNRKHRTGDVITVHTGDIGTSAIVPDSLDGSLGFATIVTRIHDKNVLLPEYLCAYLNYGGGKEQLYKYARDIRNNLNLKDFNKLIVPVPDLYRQKEIVKNVNTLNKIVCQRKQELAFFDDLIKARFVELFGTSYGNGKGFPMKTVADVIEFTGGSQPDKKYFEYEPSEDNIRLIQIRDYKTDNYITYIPKSMAKRFCDADDIMIGRYGPPIFQILKGIEGSYNVALMKATPKMGNKEFVRHFLMQDCLFDYLDGLSQRTAGQSGIEMPALKAYPFPYPPIELQNQFEKFVKQVDKSKVVVQKGLEETQNLFNSLMQQYFG